MFTMSWEIHERYAIGPISSEEFNSVEAISQNVLKLLRVAKQQLQEELISSLNLVCNVIDDDP